MSPTTSYGTVRNILGIEDLKTVVTDLTDPYTDNYAVDAVVTEYRAAINAALPAGVTLVGDEFYGPLPIDTSIHIGAAVDSVDLVPILRRNDKTLAVGTIDLYAGAEPEMVDVDQVLADQLVDRLMEGIGGGAVEGDGPVKSAEEIEEAAAAAQVEQRKAILAGSGAEFDIEPPEVLQVRMFAAGVEQSLIWVLGMEHPDLFAGIYDGYSKAARPKNAVEINDMLHSASSEARRPIPHDEDAEEEENRLLSHGVRHALQWVMGEQPDALPAPMFPIRVEVHTETQLTDFLDQQIHAALHNAGEHKLNGYLFDNDRVFGDALLTVARSLLATGVIAQTTQTQEK